jgi:pentatricopeptide repeat protein
MDAYVRLGTAEAARRCEDLLDELNQRWIDNDYHGALEPNLICYNTAMTAWAKACGSVAATNCLRLFENLPLAPDRISYNAVLHAIARSGWKDAGERAEGILNDDMMQFMANSTTTTPNARSYTTCMDAWGQSGRPEKARALLKELDKMYKATGDESLKPNEFSYSTVIHAYAISKDSDKAVAAYAVLNDMIAAGIQPNRVTYNSMLNCCATSTTHPELIDMVETVYHQLLQMKHDDGPDHVTFGTVLKACSNLLWKDETFAVTVFREAAEREKVSSGVLWQFRQAVQIDTFRESVGHDQAPRQWHDLPDAWTFNVRDERGTRRNANSSNRRS